MKRYPDDSYLIRNAIPTDVQRIAEILFGTDSFIYPTAFETATNARKLFPRIMLLDGSVYHYRNMKVAANNEGELIGAICSFNNLVVDNNIDYYTELCIENIKVKHVCDHYFNKLFHCTGARNEVYIVALCVDVKNRGKGIGKSLLNSVVNENGDKTVKLDVLADNEKAIELYRDCGFYISEGPFKGYAFPPAEPPDCYRMIRYKKNYYNSKLAFANENEVV